jgi:pimeloyl-ACP methyl ester carboxylesterase
MPSFTRDGVDLHYELEGAGPPVVYISGLSDHSNGPLGQILRPKLAERYTVVAVDNRGSGQTTVPDGARATIEDMADDIAAIMEHHQLGPVNLLGYSMGGFIALALSLRHPAKVRSQVIAGSAAHFPYGRAHFMLETVRLLQDAGVPYDLAMRVFLVSVFSEEVFLQTDLVNFVVNAPPDPFVQTRPGFDLQWAAIEAYDIRASLGDSKTPTRVLYSPDDMLVSPHLSVELVERIPGAECREYPGGHSFPMLPMNFDAFIDDVVGFWKRHS